MHEFVQKGLPQTIKTNIVTKITIFQKRKRLFRNKSYKYAIIQLLLLWNLHSYCHSQRKNYPFRVSMLLKIFASIVLLIECQAQ